MPRRTRRRSDIAVAAVARAVLAAAVALPAGALACAPVPAADPTSLHADDDAGDDDAAEARPSAPAAPRGPLVWLSSEREAVQLGREEHRPVLVRFDSPWCADCKRMEAETFGDPRVRAQAGRFVAVRIEATDDEDPQVSAALQKYTIVNVPTLILLDSSGRERRRITDPVGPETLLHEIDQVR